MSDRQDPARLGSDDPALIERDLDRTRSRLGSHLNELQDRLSPGQVVDDLMSYFRGSEGAVFGRDLVGSLRANPLPAAITGIGLAWLMASNTQARAAAGGRDAASGTTASTWRPEEVHDWDARVRAAERTVARQPDEAEHAYMGRYHDARGQAMGLTRQAQESTESYSGRIKDALARARDSVAAGASAARDQAGSVASSAASAVSGAAGAVSDAAQRAGGAVSHGVSRGASQGGDAVARMGASVAESPALLGALGLAVGALLGALLPQSEQEERALGSVADQARRAAGGLAQDAMDKGAEVARTVAETGRDSAERHGLAGGQTTPGGLVDAALDGTLAQQAKAVAADTLGATDQAVRGKVLDQDEPASKPA